MTLKGKFKLTTQISRSMTSGTHFNLDAQGNAHSQLGGYSKTDDSTQQMDDVWFAVDANYLNVANDKDWRAAA